MIQKSLVQLAQDGILGDCKDLDLPNCTSSGEIGGAGLDDILTISFTVTGILSVIFIMIGAFQYVVSGGDPKKTNTAKETILYAIVGMIISLFAFTIVRFVASNAS